MGCRTATTVEFRTRLRFNQHDPIMTKEKSVLTKIMKVLSNEKIFLKHYVLNLNSRIDLYFPEHRVAIKFDEFNHADRIKDTEREEEIKEYLKCKFIRIDPDRDNYNNLLNLVG